MKYLIFLGLAALVLLNACCDKKACAGGTPAMTPYGFDTTDMYSAVIMSYHGDGNFSERIDSFELHAQRYPSDAPIRLYKDFQPGIDYKIVFKVSGMEFRITDVRLRQEVCNHCTPNWFGQTHYDVFDGCKLNGKEENGFIELHSYIVLPE